MAPHGHGRRTMQGAVDARLRQPVPRRSGSSSGWLGGLPTPWPLGPRTSRRSGWLAARRSLLERFAKSWSNIHRPCPGLCRHRRTSESASSSSTKGVIDMMRKLTATGLAAPRSLESPAPARRSLRRPTRRGRQRPRRRAPTRGSDSRLLRLTIGISTAQRSSPYRSRSISLTSRKSLRSSNEMSCDASSNRARTVRFDENRLRT